MKNMKGFILEFIKRQKLAVISTVSIDNKPESAVLEFGQTNELELIFETFTSSRKYKNLLTNQHVSFVIGWDENMTVQYEGVAEELNSDNALPYKQIYWEKNPHAKRWASREGIVYFKVKPTWIRFSDLNKHPWDISEITL